MLELAKLSGNSLGKLWLMVYNREYCSNMECKDSGWVMIKEEMNEKKAARYQKYSFCHSCM